MRLGWNHFISIWHMGIARPFALCLWIGYIPHRNGMRLINTLLRNLRWGECWPLLSTTSTVQLPKWWSLITTCMQHTKRWDKSCRKIVIIIHWMRWVLNLKSQFPHSSCPLTVNDTCIDKRLDTKIELAFTYKSNLLSQTISHPPEKWEVWFDRLVCTMPKVHVKEFYNLQMNLVYQARPSLTLQKCEMVWLDRLIWIMV